MRINLLSKKILNKNTQALMTSRDPTIASDGPTWQVWTPLCKTLNMGDKYYIP
jgi:hypothetical protein